MGHGCHRSSAAAASAPLRPLAPEQLEGHLTNLEALIVSNGKEDGVALHGGLSGQERELLALIGQGQAIKQIAAALGVCEKTVWTMRQRVLKKLELRTTADLVKYALKRGLAD